MNKTEHTIRAVQAKDLTYWLSVLENDGWHAVVHPVEPPETWQVVARRDDEGRKSVGKQRSRGDLLAGRVADECRYARTRDELIVGLRQIVVDIAASDRRVVFDDRDVRIEPRSGGHHEVELGPERRHWRIDSLVEIFEAAENVLDVYKIRATDILPALAKPPREAAASLRKLFGSRGEFDYRVENGGDLYLRDAYLAREAITDARWASLSYLSPNDEHGFPGRYQARSGGRSTEPVDFVMQMIGGCLDDRSGDQRTS